MATPLRHGDARAIEALMRAKLSADYPSRRFVEPRGLAMLVAAFRRGLRALRRPGRG